MRRERTYESVGQIIGGVVVQICARPYFAPTLSIFIDVRFGSLADKLKPARVCKARNSGPSRSTAASLAARSYRNDGKVMSSFD
jgi:hypothetical protein